VGDLINSVSLQPVSENPTQKSHQHSCNTHTYCQHHGSWLQLKSPRNRFELLRKLQTKESIVLKQPTWDFSKRNRQSVDPIQQHMNRSPTAQARQEVIKFLYIVQQVVFFETLHPVDSQTWLRYTFVCKQNRDILK